MSLNWFHGSDRTFEKPSVQDFVKHAFKGEGVQRYGCGLYLTDSREAAQEYAELSPTGTPTIFNVRISRYATIREWDGEVSPETYQKLEDSSLPTSEKHGFEKDREAYGPITYGALYEVLAPVLDGETLRYTKKPAQNTTQFFREELGISGLSTPDTVRGGTILVLFDPDQIISWASA